MLARRNTEKYCVRPVPFHYPEVYHSQLTFPLELGTLINQDCSFVSKQPYFPTKQRQCASVTAPVLLSQRTRQSNCPSLKVCIILGKPGYRRRVTCRGTLDFADISHANCRPLLSWRLQFMPDDSKYSSLCFFTAHGSLRDSSSSPHSMLRGCLVLCGDQGLAS